MTTLDISTTPTLSKPKSRFTLKTEAERFALVLQACESDARGRLGYEDMAYPQAKRMLKAQQAALSDNTGPIAQAAAAQGLKGPQIGAQIAMARVRAVAASV